MRMRVNSLMKRVYIVMLFRSGLNRCDFVKPDVFGYNCQLQQRLEWILKFLSQRKCLPRVQCLAELLEPIG